MAELHVSAAGLVRLSLEEPDQLLVQRLRLLASLKSLAARRRMVESGIPEDAFTKPLLAFLTYRNAAVCLGVSPGRVAREAKALGIPYPLTPDDISRLGYRLWGPHGDMPRFVQGDDGHFWKVPAP